MNIQQLRYVVATADHGSMTAAASALFVAQPALSRAVRQLERELEVALFARDGRGIALTAEGERFVLGARAVLRNIEALRGIGAENSPDVPLVIAATPTLQASMGLSILQSLRNQGIDVHTRMLGASGTLAVHTLVSTGQADLGICDQVIDTDLDVVSLGIAEVKLISPLGTDLPEVISLADLMGVPLVLPTAGSDRRAALDKFFQGCGFAPTVAVESDERSVWMEAVLRGLASCMWHSVESLQIRHEGIEIRRFDPPMFRELSAVHREENRAPAKVLLLDVLADLAELQAVSSGKVRH